MLEMHPLNHYVVVEGELPLPTHEVLVAWLERHGARAVSERVWVYQALLADEGLLAERQELGRQMMAGLPSEDQPPFRVHFLAPNGTGAVSYKWPSSGWSGVGGFGSIGAGP